MSKIKNILVIGSDQSYSLEALELLELHGYEVSLAIDCSQARNWLPFNVCDAILLDFHYGDKSDCEFMTWVKSYKNKMPLIAMLEDTSVYEEARMVCQESGKIPLFNKQFAILETIDFLQQIGRAS